MTDRKEARTGAVSPVIRGPRAWLVVAAAALAAAACSTVPKQPPLLLVDQHGFPVEGAVVLPEDESAATARSYSNAEVKEQTSDAQGRVRLDLDEYYWDSDGCYHFRILRPGYEDVTVSASKELFPPVFRIVLNSTPLPRPPAPRK